MIVVEACNVKTVYGSTVVHESVSLKVQKGEIFTIAGSSGCGKSTLLRQMVMLGFPLSGQIKLFGHDIANIPRKKADELRDSFGVMFQSGGLFSYLTVLENICAPLKEKTRLPAAVIREAGLLKLLLSGLSYRAATLYPSELSGGMRKRAALARALAMDPQILFLDEPTSGLDPQSRREFDSLILNLRELLGLTVVMVSHDLASIEHTTDRIAVLGEGRTLVEGTLEQAKLCPDRIVKKFFEES